jgi:hypothetical protein
MLAASNITTVPLADRIPRTSGSSAKLATGWVPWDDVGTTILPSASVTHDLGSTSLRLRDGWIGRDLYVGNSIIGPSGFATWYIGTSPSTNLTLDYLGNVTVGNNIAAANITTSSSSGGTPKAGADGKIDAGWLPTISGLLLGMYTAGNDGAVTTNTSSGWIDVASETITLTSGDDLHIIANMIVYKSGGCCCYAEIRYDGTEMLGNDRQIEFATGEGHSITIPTALFGLAAGSHTVALSLKAAGGYTCSVMADQSSLVIQRY